MNSSEYVRFLKLLISKLGGGNSNIFWIFIPKIGEDEPIWKPKTSHRFIYRDSTRLPMVKSVFWIGLWVPKLPSRNMQGPGQVLHDCLHDCWNSLYLKFHPIPRFLPHPKNAPQRHLDLKSHKMFVSLGFCIAHEGGSTKHGHLFIDWDCWWFRNPKANHLGWC